MRVKIKIDPFGIFIDFQSCHSADKKSVSESVSVVLSVYFNNRNKSGINLSIPRNLSQAPPQGEDEIIYLNSSSPPSAYFITPRP